MIFLYHRVVAEGAPEGRYASPQALPVGVFHRHLTWLSRRFRIVALAEYLAAHRRWHGRIAAVTIDDGVQSTMRAIEPELTERGIPVTMFLPTGHLENGELYWFAYLDALCFESTVPAIEWDGACYPLATMEQRRAARRALGAMARRAGSPAGPVRALASRYPLDPAIAEEYRASTADEVRSAAAGGWIEVGCHSTTHPYLDRLPFDEQVDEIARSRAAVERVVGRPVDHFAYPAGAYTADTVRAVQVAGLCAAFACVPNRVPTNPDFEIPRVGIYSQSTLKLAAKSFGAAHLLRALDISVG